MLDIISEEEAQSILKMKNYDQEPILDEETNDLQLITVNSLPSNFIGYPEGTKISYAPLTLGELEALNGGEPDVIRNMAMLLKSIRCNTLAIEDLYYWDVMYIGIQRKLLAFGDTKGVVYNICDKCGALNSFEFDYTELTFKELEVENLPVITTIGGQEVEIGLITIKDFMEVDISRGSLDVYARMIKNMPYEDAYKLVENATGKDSKKIIRIDQILNYGIKPFTMKCTNIVDVKSENGTKKEKCNNEILMEVRSPFEVVFPEDTDFGLIDAEISFGRE